MTEPSETTDSPGRALALIPSRRRTEARKANYARAVAAKIAKRGGLAACTCGRDNSPHAGSCPVYHRERKQRVRAEGREW